MSVRDSIEQVCPRVVEFSRCSLEESSRFKLFESSLCLSHNIMLPDLLLLQ